MESRRHIFILGQLYIYLFNYQILFHIFYFCLILLGTCDISNTTKTKMWVTELLLHWFYYLYFFFLQISIQQTIFILELFQYTPTASPNIYYFIIKIKSGFSSDPK